MITPIVKMTFMARHISSFKDFFYESQKHIIAFDGCLGVDLMKDTSGPDTYFTISYWRCEDDLNNYRQSYLFKNTWSKVKRLFSAKTEAWSLIDDKDM